MTTVLQFSVGNYRSFHEPRTFSMVPSSIQDAPKSSVVALGRFKFLTSAAIYGANSSGKSNLVLAMARMRNVVKSSVKLNDNEQLPHEPFLLSQKSGNAPTYFEIVFLTDGSKRVRYGFEYDLTHIVKEWLFITNGNKPEDAYFVRDEEGIGVNEELFPEGSGLEEKTNGNRLFLSLVAQLGGEISKYVMQFFDVRFNVISGLTNTGYEGLTESQVMAQKEESEEALKFFKDLQLGFTGISTEVSLEKNSANAFTKSVDVYSYHNVYDENGNIVGEQRFRFNNCESNGTQKLFELAGPLFTTLRTGALLVVDELDAKMHPLISQQIIKLFSDPETNPNHAQLIFTTHDTNLLSAGILRRDQIWFTEKDAMESTDLYCLMNIVLPDGSKPRGDGNLERNYLKGRFGAIPYITLD